MTLSQDIEFQFQMKPYIIISLPIVSNVHGGSCLFGSICGLKAAVETSTNGASVHSLLWAAGYSAAAFCISARDMKTLREKLNSNFEADPILRKRIAITLGVGTLILLIWIFNSGSQSSSANSAYQNSDAISFICSKKKDDVSISYYLVNSVAVVGKTVSLPSILTDLTVKMSRYPSKSGWDTNALCDPNKIDLPESDWRILSIGSDCGVGAAIAACDIDTIASDRGVTGLHIFPLKNGYYSGASGKVERGTLIKVTGKVSQ